MGRISFDREGKDLLVDIKGKPDVSLVDELREVLLAQLEEGDILKLVSGKPQNADSPFLQTLCAAWKEFSGRGVVFDISRDLSARAENIGLSYCQSCIPEKERAAGKQCPLFAPALTG